MPSSTASTCASTMLNCGTKYECLVLVTPCVSVHLLVRPVSSSLFCKKPSPLVSCQKIVSISRMRRSFLTLKLSVLLLLGTKPCRLPGASPQSTRSSPLANPSAWQLITKSSTRSTHALYPPPLFGGLSYGISCTVSALWSTSLPVRCWQPPTGTTLVIIPPVTTTCRQRALSDDRSRLPDGSVTWKT